MKYALLVKDGCKFQKLIFLWTTVNDRSALRSHAIIKVAQIVASSIVFRLTQRKGRYGERYAGQY